MDYQLLDSGEGEKLEKYGDFLLVRPDPQAVWGKGYGKEVWQQAHAIFNTAWQRIKEIPDSWVIEVGGFKFVLNLKNFKHTGVFPEHTTHWNWITDTLGSEEVHVQRNVKLKILNLFGYTGGATLAALRRGAEVTHVDASKPSITAARQNVELNGLSKAPVRWILDDAKKFVQREIKRGVRYDGIILDPPSFGRGAKGEVWKIERDLLPLLMVCQDVLSSSPQFVILNGYASGYTPHAYAQLLSSAMSFPLEDVESGELSITESSPRAFILPAGIFARWASK